MNRRNLLIKTIVFIFLLSNVNANSNQFPESMSEFKKLFQNNVEHNKGFYKNIVNNNRDYYKKVIASMWGEKNVKLSSAKESVFYDKDLKTREIIDYEKGILTLEKILDKNETIDNKFVEKKLKEIKKKSVKEAIKSDPLQSEMVLDNSDILSKNLNEFIEVQTKDILVRKDSNNIVTFTLKLSKDHKEKRIKFFLPFIEKYAKQYRFDNAYILAVIHTESSFNPFAVSHVPAYGLMQIVPHTGGKDAYEKLFGINKNPSKNYLFTPEKNIELGVKYLQVIRDEYLSGIVDKNSLNYCTSISYNAGIGNTYKTFSGSKHQKKQAIKLINRLDSNDILLYLSKTSKLSSEANNYILSIKDKEKLYQQYNN